MTKMTATWTGGMRFVYTSASGHGLITDAPKEVGGGDTAATPMELLLLSLIGCTGVDVASILDRMKEPLEALEVTVEAERAEKHPKVYTKIHLTFHVKGNISPKKLERAIKLSESTYCSVSAMLGKTAEITSEYVLIQ
ncbi:MAG: OsmC family protein [Gemmatimonadales bacterium]|nr:OsmC family protein [Gemmatimonadales bacterium]